jgi:hypothetical protein
VCNANKEILRVAKKFGWRFVWRHPPICLAKWLASPPKMPGILVGVLEGGHPLCAGQPFFGPFYIFAAATNASKFSTGVFLSTP